MTPKAGEASEPHTGPCCAEYSAAPRGAQAGAVKAQSRLGPRFELAQHRPPAAGWLAHQPNPQSAQSCGIMRHGFLPQSPDAGAAGKIRSSVKRSSG